jgi:steroid 5-alpha reductase family enzyme
MTMLEAVGLGAIVVFGFMTALWALQLRTKNAGIVDVGWAASLGLLAVGYAVVSPAGTTHRLLIGLLAGGWGFRLASHLLFDRVLGHPEEGRYVALRARWGDRVNRNLFAFFGGQALLALILSVPFLLVAFRAEPSMTPWEVAGAGLWLTGMVGETIADRQLARFKRRPDSRGKTCRDGLWRVSRHPNYFFEWIIWCGFATMALGTPWGWLGVIGPALILLFLLKITGIPPTEAQALKSRGDDYRDYQRTTSAFVPWFPKRST